MLNRVSIRNIYLYSRDGCCFVDVSVVVDFDSPIRCGYPTPILHGPEGGKNSKFVFNGRNFPLRVLKVKKVHEPAHSENTLAKIISQAFLGYTSRLISVNATCILVDIFFGVGNL